MRLPVLVTGCGRSGTHFTTHLLQALGLKVNHERLGPDGSVDWHLAVRGYRQKLGVDFDLVLHQHREPLPVIRSMQTMMPESWAFIARYCPEADHPDPAVRAARYWVRWNVKAEKAARYSFPIERVDEHFPAICGLLGVAQPDRAALEAAKASRGSRARRHGYGAEITYADIERRDPLTFAKLRRLARRYGYAVEAEGGSRFARFWRSARSLPA